MYLEEALEIVDCLVKLLPTLRDPMEEDDNLEARSSYGTADWFHKAKEKAAELFPEASPVIISRLGRSHRRRTQNLHLRATSRTVARHHGSGRADRSRAIPRNWLRRLRTRVDTGSNIADSDADMSTTGVQSSHPETVLSRPLFGDDT